MFQDVCKVMPILASSEARICICSSKSWFHSPLPASRFLSHHFGVFPDSLSRPIPIAPLLHQLPYFSIAICYKEGSLCLLSQLLLDLSQLFLSSVQVQDLTLLPHMLVVMTVHTGVGALSDETRLVKSEICGTSVSPSQWNLVLLHIIFGNWRFVSSCGRKRGKTGKLGEPEVPLHVTGQYIRRGGNSVTAMMSFR